MNPSSSLAARLVTSIISPQPPLLAHRLYHSPSFPFRSHNLIFRSASSFFAASSFYQTHALPCSLSAPPRRCRLTPFFSLATLPFPILSLLFLRRSRNAFVSTLLLLICLEHAALPPLHTPLSITRMPPGGFRKPQRGVASNASFSLSVTSAYSIPRVLCGFFPRRPAHSPFSGARALPPPLLASVLLLPPPPLLSGRRKTIVRRNALVFYFQRRSQAFLQQSAWCLTYAGGEVSARN